MTPDPEFEAYLNLLGRFLRLSGRQRREIRRELETHVEDAVEDYVARGFSRHEAIVRVLDDFGDAAELAARFRSVGRTRRWIMRGTATAAGVGIVLLGSAFFSNPVAPVHAGLQTDPSLGAAAPVSAAGLTVGRGIESAEHEDQRIEGRAVLGRRIDELNITDMPLCDLLNLLAEQQNLNMVVKWSQLSEAGVERDQPITLRLKNVRLEQVLSVILEDAGHAAGAVGYEHRDGILLVTTREELFKRHVMSVYDVRDLLTAGLDWRALKLRTATAQPARMPDPAAPASFAAPVASGTLPPAATATAAEAFECAWPELELVSTITEAVMPDVWVCNGGNAAVRVYNGILIVRAPHAVHEDVARLLEMLRRVDAESRQ